MRRLLVAAVSAVWLAGCAGAPKASPAAPAARADLAGAQRAYDRGVSLYAADKYSDAREAWLQAARLAPGTALARKAQDNASRANAVIRKLRELESQ